MRYTIDMALFAILPHYTRVLLVLRGLDNHRNVAASRNLRRKAAQAVQAAARNADPTTDPRVVVWRRAYAVFGMEDAQEPSLLEALLRRAAAGQPLPDADPLTELLRAFALQHRVPVGGDDLEHISGNVWLRPARGNEFFVPPERPERPEAPPIGEIVAVDDAATVLCRRWNAWPGAFTQTTPQTCNALLYLDALPPVDRPQAEELTDRLSRLLTGFLGAQVEVYSLTREQPTADIPF
jgi:DNA/RNA-binding domain of Phe-tRNA-synthetase-like protein